MRTALIAALLCFGIAHADEPNDPEADRLAQLATVTHKQAQQTNDPKKYEEAAGYYQKYFVKPERGKEGVMAYYYGELLFKMQRYDEAAKMYERAITVEPNAKWAPEAAYAHVISTKNAVHAPDETSNKPPCADKKPCVIPPDMQRLAAAFDRYLAVVATSKDRQTMEYRRARIWYDYQHFAEAAPLFEHIFTSYPDDELATYSANLEMDCLAILKRYPELRAFVERVKKSPAMKDAITQKQVQENDAALKKRGK